MIIQGKKDAGKATLNPRVLVRILLQKERERSLATQIKIKNTKRNMKLKGNLIEKIRVQRRKMKKILKRIERVSLNLPQRK